MRLLKLLPIAAILAFTMYLTSCSLIASPTGLNADDVLLKRDVARMFPPIFFNPSDTVSYGTACAILEHNVTIFCMYPNAAPAGFPAEKLCAPGVQACREVLGDPAPPSLPIPSPPSI